MRTPRRPWRRPPARRRRDHRDARGRWSRCRMRRRAPRHPRSTTPAHPRPSICASTCVRWSRVGARRPAPATRVESPSRPRPRPRPTPHDVNESAPPGPCWPPRSIGHRKPGPSQSARDHGGCAVPIGTNGTAQAVARAPAPCGVRLPRGLLSRIWGGRLFGAVGLRTTCEERPRRSHRQRAPRPSHRPTDRPVPVCAVSDAVCRTGHLLSGGHPPALRSDPPPAPTPTLRQQPNQACVYSVLIAVARPVY